MHTVTDVWSFLAQSVERHRGEFPRIPCGLLPRFSTVVGCVAAGESQPLNFKNLGPFVTMCGHVWPFATVCDRSEPSCCVEFPKGYAEFVTADL